VNQQKGASLRARHAGSRAQSSAETLVVFLIFLCILGISASSIFHTGRAAQSRVDEMLAQNAFSEISAKISDACALGSGNVRTFFLARGKAALSASDSTLGFSSGKFFAEQQFRCAITVSSAEPSSTFRVENIDGKIEIT
jgi:hypothetical protein